MAFSERSEQTGGMTVGLETWVSIGTLLGVAVGLFVAIRTTGADLRTELKGDIAELRTELKGDIAKLDDRVYALAAGLRPQLDEERAKEAPSAR